MLCHGNGEYTVIDRIECVLFGYNGFRNCLVLSVPSRLKEAASLVLKDERFSIPLEPARRARFMAERYLEWCMRGDN